MLILTRKPGQTIHIGKDIQVIFLDNAKRNVVKVGVVAPKDVVVLRSEVRERLLLKNSTDEELFNGSKCKKQLKPSQQNDDNDIQQREYEKI